MTSVFGGANYLSPHRIFFYWMKKMIPAFAWLFAALTLPFVATAQTKSITLDDCFTFYKFYPRTSVQFQFLKDGVHYVESDESHKLHIKDVRDERIDSVIALQLPPNFQEITNLSFCADESIVLLETEPEPVYRHSTLAKHYVYDFQKKKVEPLFSDAKQQFASISDDGEHVAFVVNNNVYIKHVASNQTIQITSDGKPNHIINGIPDWVYEEEFSPVDGFGMVALKWSPDGTHLAFIRFDETEVPEMSLTWYEGGVYPRRSSFKYPKVGSPNSKVSVHLYDVAEGRMRGQLMGLEASDYCPRIYWTQGNQLIMMRLNRPQDTMQLLLSLPDRALYDQEDQKQWIPTRLLLEESDAAYVDVESSNKLVFLSDKKHFLWMSERRGWQQIYRYSFDKTDAASAVLLTQDGHDVTQFYGVDEKNGQFFYQAATPTPLDRQIWVGYLSGDAPTLLTPPAGTHEAQFSPTFDYFTHTWSDANTPPVLSICDRQDDTVRLVSKNARVRNLRQEYGFVLKEFFQFSLADGTVLNGWMIRPPDMDPDKKYPILFDNYGGPNSQTVQNQYDGYLGTWHQMLAQKGYVVASVDNRGTGGRGRDFRKCTQLQLGKLETEDQIAAARYLGGLPWADPSRIGIWGWSFGGYLSTSCILKGSDVFKMAMAVAPVTNWKWYDSAYTERYMHTSEDNKAGYEENSPVNFASLLRGDNYLICHGITDDNVHWQQSVEMINALIKANKSFETYYYPNRNHGIYGDNATQHLFRKLTDFVFERL